jgi:hypothetical protein
LLYNLLEKEGFEVKRIKVIFDWKDLPILEEILSNLEESSQIISQFLLKARIF